MPIREPAAGQFYPASRKQCEQEIAALLAGVGEEAEFTGLAVGGIVPHAGWVFSGAVGVEVLALLARQTAVETFVVFGAMHRYGGRAAGAVFASGAWETPLGRIVVDKELADAVLAGSELLADDAGAHELEHAIEVQVPFIQHLAPSARILPIIVPPSASAPRVGAVVAEQGKALGRRAVFVGSTDLTHYGPRYRFTPMGDGPEAFRWAKEVNDRRLLELVEALKSDQIVPEAIEHHNACGSGAVAAAMEASKVMGPTERTSCGIPPAMRSRATGSASRPMPWDTQAWCSSRPAAPPDLLLAGAAERSVLLNGKRLSECLDFTRRKHEHTCELETLCGGRFARRYGHAVGAGVHKTVGKASVSGHFNDFCPGRGLH
ncbi:MAG: AmmeMemoRadiSam system protein B [Phycisphaerae bacterium]